MQVHQSKHVDRLTKNDRVYMIITFGEHAQYLAHATAFASLPPKEDVQDYRPHHIWTVTLVPTLYVFCFMHFLYARHSLL